MSSREIKIMIREQARKNGRFILEDIRPTVDILRQINSLILLKELRIRKIKHGNGIATEVY